MLKYINGLIYFKTMGNSFLRSIVYLFPLSSVSYAFLLDLIFIGFIASIFSVIAEDSLPGILVIVVSMLFTMPIEIYRSYYLRSRELTRAYSHMQHKRI